VPEKQRAPLLLPAGNSFRSSLAKPLTRAGGATVLRSSHDVVVSFQQKARNSQGLVALESDSGHACSRPAPERLFQPSQKLI
jgi:hypothetical protein